MKEKICLLSLAGTVSTIYLWMVLQRQSFRLLKRYGRLCEDHFIVNIKLPFCYSLLELQIWSLVGTKMDTCPLCHLRTDLNFHVCLHGIRKPVLLRPGQPTMVSHSNGYMAQNLSSSANINMMPAFLRFPIAPPAQALPSTAPVHQMYNIINPAVSTCFLPTQVG